MSLAGIGRLTGGGGAGAQVPSEASGPTVGRCAYCGRFGPLGVCAGCGAPNRPADGGGALEARITRPVDAAELLRRG